VSWPGFESDTSRIQVRNITTRFLKLLGCNPLWDRKVLENYLNCSCIHTQVWQVSKTEKKMLLENVATVAETFHRFLCDCTGTAENTIPLLQWVA
jgi:hypothetical protein